MIKKLLLLFSLGAAGAAGAAYVHPAESELFEIEELGPEASIVELIRLARLAGSDDELRAVLDSEQANFNRGDFQQIAQAIDQVSGPVQDRTKLRESVLRLMSGVDERNFLRSALAIGSIVELVQDESGQPFAGLPRVRLRGLLGVVAQGNNQLMIHQVIELIESFT